jgi:hypothetical protein
MRYAGAFNRHRIARPRPSFSTFPLRCISLSSSVTRRVPNNLAAISRAFETSGIKFIDEKGKAVGIPGYRRMPTTVDPAKSASVANGRKRTPSYQSDSGSTDRSKSMDSPLGKSFPCHSGASMRSTGCWLAVGFSWSPAAATSVGSGFSLPPTRGRLSLARDAALRVFSDHSNHPDFL